MTDRIDFEDEVETTLELPENYDNLSPMQKAQAVRAAKREAGEDMSIERLNPLEKALRKPTPKNCINAECYLCVGEGYDTGWKWMIGNCNVPATKCGIHPLRPYQSMKGKPKPSGVL